MFAKRFFAVALLILCSASLLLAQICDGTDDRQRTGPNQWRAVGRIPVAPGGSATAWIASNGMLVTAGHARGTGMIVEFNVPSSNSDGSINDPQESDIYHINDASWVSVDNGAGDDWAVFSVYDNSVTGKQPIEVYGSLQEVQTYTAGTYTVVGYGVDGPAPYFGVPGDYNSDNETEQYSSGPDNGSSGSILRYQIDTQGGCSGAPVINSSGQVIGIHNEACTQDWQGTSFENSAFWNALHPAVTVDQNLASGSSATGSTIKRWGTNSFSLTLNPGDQINGSDPATETRVVEALQGYQQISNGQKYYKWSKGRNDEADVTNHHVFDIEPSFNGGTLTSWLNPTYDNVTVKADLLDYSGTYGNIVQFRDPWYVHYSDPNYGNAQRNLGMSAPFENMSGSSNDIGTGTGYLGVFQNQYPSPNDPEVPYYSVQAPLTTTGFTVNGTAVNGTFTGWSATNATLQQVGASPSGYDQKAVVFTNSPATVTANYKGHLLTNAQSATGFGNQRKITMDSYGRLDLVYASANKIWYTYSTNGGSSWSNEQQISGGGTASNPSISASANEDVYIVWQEIVGSVKYLYIKSLYGSIPTPLALASDVSSFDLQPAVAASDNGTVLIVYRKSDGLGNPYKLYYTYSSDGLTFSSGQQVFISTPVDFDHPSVAWNPQSTNFVVSANSRSGTFTIPFLTFNGTSWQWPANVYTSSTFPQATPYSQIAVDGTGRTHITWIGYDNYYDENSAAMHRSCLNGNWSAVNIFRDEVLYDPAITSTSVAAHNDADGGVSIFYTHNPRSQVLFDVYSTNGTSFIGSYWITPSAPIYNPNALERVTPQQVTYSVTKGSSSPYGLVLQTRDNTVSGTHTGTLKSSESGDKVYMVSSDTWSIYRRLDLVDTTTGGELIIQFGNISSGENRINNFEKDDAPCPGVIDPSFMKSGYFDLDQRTPVTFGTGCRSKNWTQNIRVNIELMDSSTGNVISELRSFSFPTSDTTSYMNAAISRITNIDRAKTACIRVEVQGVDSSKVVVTPVNVYVLNDAPSNGGQQPQSIYSSLPTSFALQQNYPNPFNPTTTIQYALPVSGHVTLRISDVLGREVRTLVDEDEPAGYHSVIFDASQLPSGVYFYRITSGKFASVKKLVLVK